MHSIIMRESAWKLEKQTTCPGLRETQNFFERTNGYLFRGLSHEHVIFINEIDFNA